MHTAIRISLKTTKLEKSANNEILCSYLYEMLRIGHRKKISVCLRLSKKECGLGKNENDYKWASLGAANMV